jgi:paraquat-inducible protein B
MSKPANKKVIGAFVLGAIALLIVAVMVFGSGKIFKKTVPVVFYFPGSVKGLNVGAPLTIRGVQVGSVTDVALQFNPQDLSTRIQVFAEWDPEKITKLGVGEKAILPGQRREQLKKLIDRGLRAQLQTQSLLTGLLLIDLDFMPNTPVQLVGTDTKRLEIPTVPTTLEELAAKLEKLPIEPIFNKLASTLEHLEKVISSPNVEGGIKDLAQGIKEVRALVKNIDEEIKPLSTGVQDTLKDTRGFIKGTDAELKKTLAEARAALAQAEKALQAMQGSYEEGSTFYYEVTNALEGLTEASRSLRSVAEYLKQHPDAVIWGKEKSGGK